MALKNNRYPVDEAGQMPAQPSRRNFMTGLVSAFAALWALMTLYPVYRYLRAPARAGGTSNVSSVIVAAVDEIPVDTGRNFQFGSVPAVVIRTAEEEFHAFNAICTHLGCTVQFRPEMDRIWCACHGGQYDPVTGKNLAGPPPRPLEPLKAAIVDGNVVVSRA